MKAPGIINITEKMTEGNNELAEALNKNFEILNDHAHKREIAIFNRLQSIERKMD